MKNLAVFALFALLSTLLLLLQETLPPIPLTHDTHFPLAQFLFCLGAIWLPFPLMLLLALWLGCTYDLLHLQFLDSSAKTELPLGITALYFLLAGSVCQGIRESIQKGNLWPAPILFSLTAAGLPTLEISLITYLRFEKTNRFFDSTLLFPILNQTLLALAASSLLVAILYLARIASLRPRISTHPRP